MQGGPASSEATPSAAEACSTAVTATADHGGDSVLGAAAPGGCLAPAPPASGTSCVALVVAEPPARALAATGEGLEGEVRGKGPGDAKFASRTEERDGEEVKSPRSKL